MARPSTTSALRRWLSWLLRLAVCAAAVWYLYGKVSWYDHATLADDLNRTCRVLGDSAADPLQLEDAATGRRFTAPRSALASREALALLNRHPIEPGLRSIVRRMKPDWAIAALLALTPTTFLLAWRLRYLLAMQRIEMSFGEAVLLTFAGNFFNFALPGTTGGDIYKAYHVARHAHRRTEGVTIVFIDRAIGLVSFVLLAALCLAFLFQRSALGWLGRLVGALLGLTIVGALVFFSRRFRRGIGYEALLKRLPMADRLRRVDQTAFSFRYHPRESLAALAVTTLNNGFLALMILCLARALGMPRDGSEPSAAGYASMYLSSMLALSAGYLVAAVPVSVQGFGLLEAVFLRVFTGGGWGTASQVIALCLGARVFQLVWSLPGIVVPWLGLGRPSAEAAAELAAEAQSEESLAADQ